MKRILLVLSCMVYGISQHAAETQKRMYVKGHAHETAVEDLASEHGIVERLILIYEEMLHRLRTNQTFAAHDLYLTADMMHQFVELYHEKIEEDYVFPVLEEKHSADRLTAELRKQHVAGRAITQRLLEMSQQPTWNKQQRQTIKKKLSQFITMYRVHISREDTEIFPEFRKLVSKEEYERLSKLFDDIEEETFGKGSYKKFLRQIEEIEKRLDIYDIANVTPDFAKASPDRPLE